MRFLSGIYVMLLVFFLLLVSVLDRSKVSFYEETLTSAVELSARHALENACVKKAYEVEDEESLYRDFCAELIFMMSPVSDLSVRVYEISLEDGILDVEAFITYPLFCGEKTSCVRRRAEVVS